MPYYLLQAAYSPEALAAMIKNPQNRVDAIRPGIEALGGRIVDAYFSFGEYDIACIIEMPDNVSAAAFAIKGGSSGVARTFKTTPLLTPEEAVEAMSKGGSVDYQPPG